MTTPCPCDGCESVYECDACLDQHLRRAHGTDYAQAYGRVPEAWMARCQTHRNVPAQRLGGVDQTPAIAQI